MAAAAEREVKAISRVTTPRLLSIRINRRLTSGFTGFPASNHALRLHAPKAKNDREKTDHPPNRRFLQKENTVGEPIDLVDC